MWIKNSLDEWINLDIFHCLSVRESINDSQDETRKIFAITGYSDRLNKPIELDLFDDEQKAKDWLNEIMGHKKPSLPVREPGVTANSTFT